MTALKRSGIGLVVLLVFQALWPVSALSQPAGGPGFSEEISKQESIYQGRGAQLVEGYVIDRSLLSYGHALSEAFDRSLASLGPEDRWLDIGAGQGQAILDYYTPGLDPMHAERSEWAGRKARAVAISIEDRRTPLWHQTAARLEANKIQYLSGKRLREYSPEELGRFQLISDVIGGFSYTENLSLFLERVLSLLDLNSGFYTLLQDVNSEAGITRPFYEGSPFLTEIKNADGSELKVCSWLKSISCVEVTCEIKTEWKPPVEGYRIQKVCNNVIVPALLQVHYEAGTPPERGYRLVTPSPASPGLSGPMR